MGDGKHTNKKRDWGIVHGSPNGHLEGFFLHIHQTQILNMENYSNISPAESQHHVYIGCLS